MIRHAEFNSNRTHRYLLTRIWDITKPKLMFVGLNPSTANEHKDDNTIKKVIKIATHNGFGSCYMLNLFSLVSKDSKNKEIPHNTEINNVYLRKYSFECDAIVFAWGGFKIAKDRAKEVIELIPIACCIKKNKDGSPVHPLYQLDESVLIKF